MFSLDIVASDAFLDMSTSTRELYFQLCMYADDDGFVNPKKIMRMVGASGDDLKVLLVKRFLLTFETGVVVIKHWLIHNLIRTDRYKETMYLEEKKSLKIKENKAYTDSATKRQPNGDISQPQYSIDKDSIDKIRLDKNTSIVASDKLIFGEFKNVKLLKEEEDKLVKTFGEKNTRILIEELSGYIASKRKNYASHYATLLNWGRRKVMEHTEKLQNGKRSII